MRHAFPLIAALCLTGMPALADDGRILASVAAITDATERKDEKSFTVDRCRIDFSFANEGPDGVDLMVEVQRLLKEGSWSAMVAPPPRAFGVATKVGGYVDPGETYESHIELIGVECPDVVGMVMLPECTLRDTGADCAATLVAAPGTLVPIGMPHDEEPEVPENHEGDAAAGIETTAPGPVQGIWRVVRTDIDETPVMRLSIVQDEGGAPEGDFSLLAGICDFGGAGRSCELDGEAGVFRFGHHDARRGRTTLVFAPTADPKAGFSLQWAEEGEATLRPLSGEAVMPVRVIAVALPE